MSEEYTPMQIGRKSAAASTHFCATKVEGPGGHIWLDGNGKVTASNGTLDDPKPNAFSLPAGNTEARRAWCPSSTEVCRKECYVHGLEANAAETFALYEHNGRMLLDVILRDAATTDAWAYALGDYISANVSEFRWHVSGDVRSADHAQWIAAVANRSPRNRHWIYTRSLFALPWLLNDATEENLTVNVSCDAENYAAALTAWFAWHGRIRLCYLTVDGVVPDSLPSGSVVFPSYGVRWPDGAEQPAWLGELPSEQRRMVCSVDLRGKSEKRRCGLSRCAMCIHPPIV